jgi:hypothetical protein
MSNERRTIEIHIVMTESGACVVDEDAGVAAERADEEFPDEDLRQCCHYPIAASESRA